MQISRLRVGNEDFLVSSMIERCPKSMMLRELVKNGLEAASNATAGGKRVEIGPLMVDGGRKLAIWNSGPGMNAEELYRMCDIASSIGKANGLDQNFGMGAKVASLPSNHHGIRYRSCKGGQVHQVVMGKRNEVYGRLHQTGPDDAVVDVLNVTAQAAADGRPLEYDWTEVVLLGMRPEQDTVADPYDGNPKMPASWVAEELYGRFYDLPAGIALILKAGVNTGDGDRAFAPIGARMGDFARHEAVPAERGIVIHYVYDAPDPDKPGALMSARGASQPARSSAAIVYQGEIYDLRPSWSWMTEAPVYGVPFGAKHFSAFVELPADFPLRPDGYRQFLRHADNLQKQIEAREFAPVVMRHRPEWMLELLRKFAPDAKHTDVVRDEMGDMFKSLQVKRRFWPVDPQGRTWPKPEGPWDGKHEYEVSPQIIPLRDIADIRERGIEGKAARFYPETHQVFINTTYGAFNDLRQKLEQEFAAAEDQERMRRAALTVTERIVIRSICRKLVFALSKRDSWDRWGMDAATSMHCLTLAADDQEGVYARARQDVANMLGAEAVDRTRAANVANAGTKFAAAMAELLAASGAQKHVLEVKLTQ